MQHENPVRIIDEPWPVKDVERWEPPPPPGDEDAPFGGALNGTKNVGTTNIEREPIRLLTIDDLANLPNPTWLVRDWLPEHGLTVLYGPSGSYKSFLALAWSLHIASGTPWYGREVKPGPVVYLSLEGGFGLARRVEAWRREVPDADLSDNFRAVVAPLSLLEKPTVEELARVVGEVFDAPAMIVVDTMSRAMLGGDENSPTDVGALIGALDELMHLWSCASLLVHHTGHGDKSRERGHSSLPAAADCRIGMTRVTDRVTVEQVKSKDSEEQDPLMLARRVVELDEVDDYGRPVTSMVLDYVGNTTPALPQDNKDEECERAILDVLGKASGGLSKNAIELQVDGFGAAAIRAALKRMAGVQVRQEKRGQAVLNFLATPSLTDEMETPV